MQTASGCVARPANVVTLANLTRFSRGHHANQTAASRQNLPVIEGEAEGALAIWVLLIIVLAAIGLTALGVAAMIHRLFPAPMHDSVSLFCERERDS
jgi:hypothetical protein